ncbi:NUDIX domain-containing protein [Chryseobacterium ginsengisoli]|uniref:NUDIX domain-containing protein n=1 Tax=Chryseobacterium ginsengisoli TaxID=363853 RepID=A0ABP9M5E8_9FLAO
MKISAGILLFKKENEKYLYFLVHPGGPFWKNKNLGTWSIPKGEALEGEKLIDRALIEFNEETGKKVDGDFIKLKPIKQKGGKTVFAWALEGDLEMSDFQSNIISFQWPPKSGKTIEIPEVDQWEWFETEEAKKRINPAQVEFINEIEKLMKSK